MPPGFKGKVGLGKSSFIKYRPVYTSTAAQFLAQAWCRDEIAQINQTLPASGQIAIDLVAPCNESVALEKSAVDATPPLDSNGQLDKSVQQLDLQILSRLQALPNMINESSRDTMCETVLKAHSDYYQYCPNSGKPQKTWADQQKAIHRAQNIPVTSRRRFNGRFGAAGPQF